MVSEASDSCRLQDGYRLVESLHDAVLAQYRQSVEKGRSGGAAGHGQAYGSEKLTRLQAQPLRQGAQDALQNCDIELYDGVQLLDNGLQRAEGSVLVQSLGG